MVHRGATQRGRRKRVRFLLSPLLAVVACVAAARSHAAPGSLANRVVFSPAQLVLDNPSSSGATTEPAAVTVEVRAFDASGRRLLPSEARPLVVEVQGDRAGTLTPRRVRLTEGSVATFQYDGKFFADPMTLVAWLDAGDGTTFVATDGEDEDPGVGRPVGRTRVLAQNAVACTPAPGAFTLRVLCEDGGTVEECALEAIRHGLRVRAAVGHDDATGSLVPFTIDTGSIGTVVPKRRLGPDAIGPGAPGRVYYDSSGRIFSGHYYLASVAFELEDGRIVQTPRMLVLGIDDQTCADGHSTCRPDSDPQLHYLGVGFARGSGAVDRFVSPADNAFLRLAEASDGRVSPGYVLTGRTITIGVPTSGYALQTLAPSATSPGDWSAAHGCYAFPELPEPNRFCGSFLLDVGLTEMFLDLPPPLRPPGSAETTRCRGGREGSRCTYVPAGTSMRILAGPPDAPAMAYDFTLRRDPVGPEPAYAEWIDRESTFVNVGRRPLFRFHYLFDARCGNVGFARVD